MKQNKNGISLIVLVITIIVMTILASTIILSLSNDNIFNKAEEAVNKTNLKTIQELASTLWAQAYIQGARTKTEFETAITEGLKGYDTSKCAIYVTTSGVKVYEFPQAWKANITTIVDGVPIPKGFVVSPYDGENTKNSGLVIYELDAGKTAITPGETQLQSLTGRNQYVWVPVDDFSKFKRQNFGNSSLSIVETDIGIEGYWEVILDSTNMPDVAKNTAKSSFMTVVTPTNGITNTLAEVQAMYASVKEYGGFYIARYEAGLDIDDRKKEDDGEIKTSVHSKMNKAPYNYVRWTVNNKTSEDIDGAVEVARSLYPVNSSSNTTGVVSTLVYGVQWDRTLDWYIETKAMTLSQVTSNSTNYGNYKNQDIASYIELNTGAQYSSDAGQNYNPITQGYTKGSDVTNETHILTTGALKAAKINNIYDMAGNLFEWTMEGRSIDGRALRGGYFYDSASAFPISNRFYRAPNGASSSYGFRTALYIKK